MIVSGLEGVRDPFVLRKGNSYYLYGTGVLDDDGNWENTQWACYTNHSGKLDGCWIKTSAPVYEKPIGASKNLWAPEVHKYQGFYYMFATYYWKKTATEAARF